MRYLIGTAGWAYNDWEGVFYPSKQKGSFDFLSYYSTFFNIVEVNASYYTYLQPETANQWLRKIGHNADFLFTLKLHQDFTHIRNYTARDVASTKSVLDILAGAGRLAGLLLQFSYSFMYSSEAALYISTLNKIFSEYRLFFEFRNRSWFSTESLSGMREQKINICAIDQPIIGAALPFRIEKSFRDSYIRLHGRNSAAWTESIRNFAGGKKNSDPNARYQYYYSQSEIQEIRLKIEKATEFNTGDVFIIFNNHPFGYAPANALELKIILEQFKYDFPMHIALNFPRLGMLH